MVPYVPSEKTDPPAHDRKILEPVALEAAEAIAEVASHYAYDGAFAGELNFFLTRLIQHLPRALQKFCGFKDEIRYWTQPLMYGVLIDVALEHKLRVNQSYEAAQILKSGDCYDTPYYTRLVEVVRRDGSHVGWQHVMLKRDETTLFADRLDGKIVLDS